MPVPIRLTNKTITQIGEGLAEAEVIDLGNLFPDDVGSMGMNEKRMRECTQKGKKGKREACV